MLKLMNDYYDDLQWKNKLLKMTS